MIDMSKAAVRHGAVRLCLGLAILGSIVACEGEVSFSPEFAGVGEGTSASTGIVRVDLIPNRIACHVGRTVSFAAKPYGTNDVYVSDRRVHFKARDSSLVLVTRTGSQTATLTCQARGVTWVVARIEDQRDSSRVTISSTTSTSTGLVGIRITPVSTSLAPGVIQQFAAVGERADGSTAPVGVRYHATGGTITAGGLYTAGTTAGSYRVVAVDSGGALADTAAVTVVTSNSPTSCAEPCVSAGADVTGSVGQPVVLQGQAPSGWKVVWSVASGPRRGKFAHESFVSDFEEGTIGEWTGTPIQQQCNQQLGPDGAQGGNGSRVTTGRSHTGSYGWEAYNNPNDCDSIGKYSAKLLRWRFPWTHWYAEGWFWWPPEYNLAGTSGGGYLNLMQWKEGASPYDPTAIIAVTGRYTGTDEFILHDYKAGTFTRLGATVPKGRWVHLAAWVKATTSGELWVWVDGKLITRQTGLNVRGNTPAGANMMWGVGNYSQYGMGQRLWWDDVSATNDGGQVVTPTFVAPVAGTYVVRMTASDGASSRTDETTVTIR